MFDSGDMPLMEAISWLVFQAPMFFAWLVGLILALWYCRRYPAVSILLVIVAVLSGLKAVTMALVHSYGPYLVGMDLHRLLNFFNSFLDALLWGLMLLAVFGWRQPPIRQREFEREPFL